MSRATDAERIASSLLASGAQTEAQAELARAPKSVSDGVAKMLVKELRGARSSQVIRLVQTLGPVWFEGGRRRILVALLEVMHDRETMRAVAYVERLPARSDPGSKSLAARIASVFARSWTIAVFAPSLVVALPIFFVGGATLRVGIAIGFGVAALLAVTIDAFVRRCPKCRTLLGGVVTGLRAAGSYTDSVMVDTSAGPARIDQTRTTWATRLRCAHCDHEWER